MMAAILNSAMLDSATAILDSDTLLSSLRFTQKHSHSTLTLTQTNSIWLTWWWQPSWILLPWIQPFCTKLWLKLIQSDSTSFILTQLDDVSHLEFCLLLVSHFEQKNFTHSFWLNLMMAAILNSAMLDSDTAILDWDTLLSSLRFTQNTLTPHWIWLKLIQSDSNSFILTSLDDVSHLEFCHLGFNHFEQIKTSLIHCHSTWGWQPSWILPSWIQPLCTKKTSLIHSDSTWWWQPSWILPSWIWPSWIQPS